MSSSNPSKERPTMRASLWLAGLSLLALGACASDGGDRHAKADPPPLTPSERYAIEVRPNPEELKLGAHAEGISGNQADALRDFIARWNEADRGEIVVKAPEHGPPPAGVYRTATSARDYLIAQGVPAADVRIVGYEASGDGQAPVVVGFMRYVAKGPQCGQSWEDLARTFDNSEYKQFGCSVTANMAAQIADPGDLLRPRSFDPPDAARRQTVLDKYRTGSNTSSAKENQASGAISTATQ
jgi:pilus assembly protein CpaD